MSGFGRCRIQDCPLDVVLPLEGGSRSIDLMPHRLLILGEVAGVDWLAGKASFAATPLEAQRALLLEKPNMIVLSEAKWAQSLVKNIPNDVRPPVLAIGGLVTQHLGIADDWLATFPAPQALPAH